METIFKNKTIQPTINSIIKTLQNKFGKIPISVFLNSNGTREKIEIGKKLSSLEKNWVKDKFPELS